MKKKPHTHTISILPTTSSFTFPLFRVTKHVSGAFCEVLIGIAGKIIDISYVVS